jgi:hypothetical protein
LPDHSGRFTVERGRIEFTDTVDRVFDWTESLEA